MFEQHFQRQRTLAPSFEEEGNLNQDNIILPSLEFIFSGKVKGFFFFCTFKNEICIFLYPHINGKIS